MLLLLFCLNANLKNKIYVFWSLKKMWIHLEIIMSTDRLDLPAPNVSPS